MVPLIFVKFSGVNKAAISHRSDYGGQSLLLGRQRMKDRLIAENICKTDTSVRPRIDEYLYDMDCVNEALANMLVHNDWTETEPLVAFYSDRVVFTSHGGLPQGITEEEFFMGVSRPRNATLMRIFLNLGIIEHTGYGVPLIVKKYGREAFDIHRTYIDVTIPFNQAVFEPKEPSRLRRPHHKGVDEAIPLDKDEQRIIQELAKKPNITYNELMLKLGVSRKTVSRKLASLVEKEQIERVGNNRTGYWKITR